MLVSVRYLFILYFQLMTGLQPEQNGMRLHRDTSSAYRAADII